MPQRPVRPRAPHEQLLSAIFSVVVALAVLAAVFLGNWIFVWEIYLVVGPVVAGLCVYR